MYFIAQENLALRKYPLLQNLLRVDKLEMNEHYNARYDANEILIIFTR